MQVKLEQFVGANVYSLTGVSFEPDMGEGSAVKFILNGETYVAREDPSDGYRSCLRDIQVGLFNVTNRFPACAVKARWIKDDGEYRKSEIVEFVDVKTDKVVLAIGTRDADGYYPCFVASFDPEAMAQNTDLEALEEQRHQARLQKDAQDEAAAAIERARAAQGWGAF